MNKAPGRKLAALLLGALLWLTAAGAWPQTQAAQGSTQSQDSVVLRTSYWVDTSGQATLDQVLALPAGAVAAVGVPLNLDLASGAIWLRHELPELDAQRRWYLLLEGPSYTNRANFYQRDADGVWRMQQAGDRVPMSQWTRPELLPTFSVDARTGGTIWMRLETFPTTIAPTQVLIDEATLNQRRNTSLFTLGAYFGFGLLVLFIGWVHQRLYGDRAFVAYMAYAACMLGFQISFNGVGALFIWPQWGWWNDASPAIFVLWLTASGIWFVREVAALSRHSRWLNRWVMRWSLAGFLFPLVYLPFTNLLTLQILNLYGFLSVLLSMGLCIWAWRKGEIHAGWTALGFLPLHLAYPLPALRTAGLLADSWFTQHALLIGSAIEIPLLLYILHRRARDFSENRARMRAIDSTDPLTGLPILPVLLLRSGDAIRRARRDRTHCGIALVELSNHADIAHEEGREVADRALVVTASLLTFIAREIDTTCRVSDTRFVVLFESPYRPEALRLFAQHIIAKGLAKPESLPQHVNLRLRVVTVSLPDWTLSQPAAEERDVTQLIARLHTALDKLDPKRVVLHLPLVLSAPPAPQPG